MTNSINNDSKRPITILDGGMGRELERRGAPFRQPEWSALALLEAPYHVLSTHLDFIKAGANVITINSYAVTPFHLGERFYDEGSSLAMTAAKLADQAVQSSNNAASPTPDQTPVQIAACLPPLFGSYRPDLFDSEQAPQIARPLIEAQAPFADIWLAETVSSIQEAVIWHELVAKYANDNESASNEVGINEENISDGSVYERSNKPFWVAFTLDDSELDTQLTAQLRVQLNQSLSNTDPSTQPTAAPLPAVTLRSGEPVTEAVKIMIALGVDAILFNCSQPEVMSAALRAAKAIIDRADGQQRLGVYANAFAPKQVHKQANAELRGIRQDTTPENYLTWARQWRDMGADIIGGCCGIGTEHIAKLAEGLKSTDKNQP